MRIDCDAFWLQKAGNVEDEYEDAFAFSPLDRRWREFRCAVADGATETSFSGSWARLLAEAFVAQRLDRPTQQVLATSESLASLAARWRDQIDARTRDKPLPWYAQAKLEQGAFSSLIGLSLRANGAWRALCVGDSCLFHVRPRQAIWAFPYYQSEQFDNHPLLISTDPALNTEVQPQGVRGRWRDGDFFLLMTDALANFFISQPRLRRQLVAATTQAQFEQIVAQARADRFLRNDDVTYLKVCPSFGDVPRGAG